MEQANQDYVESSGTGVMVCNLPLLFTRGYPSSLQHMNLDELEDFVPFMVRCSLGEENPVPWSQLPRPAWWPRKLPFRIPSGNTPTAKMTALIDLVHRCYSFHGCDYLLQFCSSLLEDMPRTGHRFNDNRDGTTSMYHGTTGKLLVTFRNENRDYDKSNHDTSLRKKLLLSPTRVNSSGTATAVFQPAATDIYLCDKCENEFYSLREVQIHEKKCCGEAPPSPVPPSPDPEPAEEDLEPAGQVPFLAYFRLQPAKHTGIEPYMSPRKRSSSPPRKLIGSMFPRFESIPLTSPLGKFLLANSKLRNKYQASQHLVIRYERHLHATPHTDIVSSRDRCNNRWIVVWRPNKEEQPWCHLYCFSKRQKRERLLTIETGLNRRTRELLSKCRPVTVAVKRLQKRVVDRIKRLNGPSAPCIDLTDEPQRLFTDMYFHYPGTFVPSSTACGITLNGTPKSEDPLRLFYDSNETTLNFGASSSSSPSLFHPPVVPVPVGSRHVGITQHLHHNWGNESEPPEQDPLAFNPGDIINHDIISILPITPTNMLQNHSSLSMGGNVNHSTPRQSNSHCKGLSRTPPPGPKCSKINREALSKRQHVQQQPGNTYMLSNSDLLQLTQGNYGVLGRFHTNEREMSVSASTTVSGLSVSSTNSPQNLNRYQGNSLKTCIKNSVPLLPENNSMVLPHTTGAPPGRNSLIEVIDLSSDDDDSGRVRVYSEADRAPSQLDGLSCYPHSGVKMPGSSKSSLPKNGNSHWSSNCKSHCDAGRVGDLATNGQPPNVLKNPAFVNQSFNCSEFPLPSSVQPHNRTETNSRKRPCEDPPPDYIGGKLVVLDVSSVGMKVVSWGNLSESDLTAMSCRPFGEKALAHPVAAPRDTEREVRGRLVQQQGISGDVDVHPGFSQSGAFVSTARCQYSLEKNEPCNHQNHLLKERKSDSSVVKGKKISRINQKLDLETEKVHGGLLKNLVSTVSKGVGYICSLVGAASNDGMESVSNNTVESNSRCSINLTYLGDSALKRNVSSSSLKDREFGGDSQSTKVPKEVAKLLKDECRELNRNGLSDLRSIDTQNCKLTRRSVERTVPRRALRQRIEETSQNNEEYAEDCNYLDNMSERSAALSVSSKSSDMLSNYMDENGNSPSYSKTKLNKEAQYAQYLSQVEGSNKNNNNNNNSDNNNDNEVMNGIDNNNDIVGQFVSGRKDKTFTDHYRGSVGGAAFLNRSRLQSSDCNAMYIIPRSEVSESLIEHLARVKRDGSLGSTNKRERLTLNNSVNEFERSFQEELGRENCHNRIDIEPVLIKSVGPKEAWKAECHCSLAKKSVLPDSSLHNGTCGRHILAAAEEDSETTTFHAVQEIVCSSSSCGSTAEDCSILPVQGPLAGRLAGSNGMLPGVKEKGQNLFQGANACREETPVNILELENRRKASNITITRKKVPISLQEYVTRDTLKERQGNIYHPVNSLSKLNSISNTPDEADNVENMPLHKSVHSVNKKCKDKRLRLSVEPTLNVDELQPSVGGSRSSYVATASGSTTSHDKASKDETVGSRFKSAEGIRKKRHLRELNNLGKDEWKEMQKRDFRPSSLIIFSAEQRCSSDESENELESDNGEVQKKKPENVKELFKKDVTLNKKKKALYRELQNLSKDEWKEVHGTGFHPSDLIFAETSQEVLPHVMDDKKQELYEKQAHESTVQIPGELTGRNGVEEDETKSKDESGDKTSKKHKKASIPRELINLGKDEWKEMRNTGFHPSDLVGSRSDEVTYFFGDSEGEEEDSDFIENDPPHKMLSDVQEKRSKKKNFSRELATLMRDECKELKRKHKGANALMRINRRHRRENGGVDLSKSARYPNSVSLVSAISDKTRKEQKANRYATARNTRSQTNVVSLVEVFTPRDSHRQLLHTETAMCVLNFNLPMIS
ncbi:LOW QUALITY PROTEIN: uncharacterized protein LOC135226367 [Macrobrachium nipponense]|uniref:LOW QUALITY PROTEIN: uncharacterized protein LOC135226367 n=1 Tax=Macrobrachium nipponense TaxID=159736 RepID=UPI0030C895B1